MALDAGHVEALRMVAALFRQFSVVDRSIEIDHCGDFRTAPLMRPGIIDKQPAGGFANERDFRSIGVVLRGIGSYPVNRAIDIRDRLWKLDLGREPIVDAEPRKSGLFERVEQGPHIAALTSLVEASTMDQDGRRKRPR